MAYNLRRLTTLDDHDFHIPEHHILLVINSWSHSKQIGSFVCDVIIKYAYILPQILFGLARPISIDSRLMISNIDKFYAKYNTLKPLNSSADSSPIKFKDKVLVCFTPHGGDYEFLMQNEQLFGKEPVTINTISLKDKSKECSFGTVVMPSF